MSTAVTFEDDFEVFTLWEDLSRSTHILHWFSQGRSEIRLDVFAGDMNECDLEVI